MSSRDALLRRAEFRFRPGMLVLGILLLGGGGALVAMGTWNQRLWHKHHHVLDLRLLENDIIAALGLAVAAFLVLTLLARPRLVAAFDGIHVSGFLRHRYAPWDRLGRFAVINGQGGRRRLEALWLPPSDSDARPTRFVIPDVYDKPPEVVAETLEAIRLEHGIEPAARAPAPQMAEQLGLQGLAVPWITLSLAMVMFAIFVAELVLHGTPAHGVVSRRVLVSLGGLTRAGVVERDEWWRLLSATYLHASFAHIMGNVVVMLLIGWRLERLIGHAWLATTFVLSALVGWVASLAVLPQTVVAVGASGGIMGLLACALVVSFRLPRDDHERRRLQLWSLRIAIPALLPLQGMEGGLVTDYAAHVGGVIGGCLVGLPLLAIWRRDVADTEVDWQDLRTSLRGRASTALPPLRTPAFLIGVAGFGGAAYAAYRAMQSLLP